MKITEALKTKYMYCIEVSVIQKLLVTLIIVINEYKTACSNLLNIQ